MKEKLTNDPNYYKRKKREWYLENKESVREQAKRWKEANPERWKEVQTLWRQKNAHRIKLYEKGSQQKQNLKRKYNLTIEQYDQMLQTQAGVCAICEQPCSTGRRLSVDHDHITGKIRGLLCTKCNIRLGMIESVNAMRFKLRPFLRYLKKHRA